MANTTIDLVGLDFDSIKGNLKTFLRGKSAFQDIDFEGSNINVLLDVLAYNSYLNSFYLNMVASEMFIDSATLRDSVVSHAKELNYLPQSYRSSYAVLQVDITPSTSVSSVVIPKYTSFTAKVGSNSYTFTTDSSVVLTDVVNGTFSANLTVYEGTVITDTFIRTSLPSQRFVMSNPTVDTNSIDVTVVEDNGITILDYVYAESVYNASSNSQVFYLQPAENQQYELVFGENRLGRSPKEGAAISVNYRACSGELPNGATVFTVDGAIDGHSNVVVTTVDAAVGGQINESIESIRLNAPRTFATQQRAVTASDYETLLKANFAEITSISAYGGEEMTPPEYGKVYVTIDIKDANGIPNSRKKVYLDFIKTKTPLAIDVEILDPEFIYYAVYTDVKYDTRNTRKSASEIKALVLGAIETYNNNFLNGFNKTLRFSKLARAMDDVDRSIVGNDPRIRLIKYITPELGTAFSLTFSFNQPLEAEAGVNLAVFNVADSTSAPESHYGHALRSTPFTYQNKQCIFVDNSLGSIFLAEYATSQDGVALTEPLITPKLLAGSINYETGDVSLQGVTIGGYTGPAIKMIAKPVTNDVFSSRNTIITLDINETTVNVTGLLA